MLASVLTENNRQNAPDDIKMYGIERNALEFVFKNQLKNLSLWRDFADVFRRSPDDKDDGWRGEYWGKMMRGACMAYKTLRSYELYRILTNSIYDIIGTQDKSGRISSYSVSNEFSGWDLWCRKYVMLGMEYYIDICKDKRFIGIIIECLKKQADYIVAKIGDEPGKTDIFATSNWWGAMNSCSILEPFVRLYNLTSEKKYLDFAEYIIGKGFCSKLNIIETCRTKALYPYQFPYTKAYEMMSCFEGLLEYYRIKGGEDYLTAAENFADMVAQTDVTAIGCCGCTHELFDNSSIKQTEPAQEYVMQETCVTVTWMKLCYNLLTLTGNVKYAAFIEQSGYNALIGAVNFNLNDLKFCENQTADLNNGVKYIFDSYSPLYYDCRGKKIGGHKDYKKNYYYGCCNCIGAAGVALLNTFGVSRAEAGFAINNYERLRAKVGDFDVTVNGSLCKKGKCIVKIDRSPKTPAAALLRIPDWSCDFSVKINGAPVGEIQPETTEYSGYMKIYRQWQSGDTIEIKAKVPVKRLILNDKAAFTKGFYVLARDEMLDDNFYEPIDINAKFSAGKNEVKCQISYNAVENSGETVKFIDYASAGQNYDEEHCKITVWSKIAK